MPPGQAFNWLAVAHSTLQVLDHALKYRAAQVQLTRVPTSRLSQNQRHSSEDHENTQGFDEPAPHSPPQSFVRQSHLLEANDAWLGQIQFSAIPLPPLSGLEAPNTPGTTAASFATGLLSQESNPTATAFSTECEAEPSGQSPFVLETEALPQEIPEVPHDVRPTSIMRSSNISPLQVLASPPESERHLQSSKVPSSRIGRLFHYGGNAYTRRVPLSLADIRCRLRPRSLAWLWRRF